MYEDRYREEDQREDDQRNSDRVAETVNGVLVASGVLRDPVVPRAIAEHKAPQQRSIGRRYRESQGALPVVVVAVRLSPLSQRFCAPNDMGDLCNASRCAT